MNYFFQQKIYNEFKFKNRPIYLFFSKIFLKKKLKKYIEELHDSIDINSEILRNDISDLYNIYCSIGYNGCNADLSFNKSKSVKGDIFLEIFDEYKVEVELFFSGYQKDQIIVNETIDESKINHYAIFSKGKIVSTYPSSVSRYKNYDVIHMIIDRIHVAMMNIIDLNIRNDKGEYNYE